LLGNQYYHGLIRRYVVYFGTLFNDLKVVRTDASGITSEVIEVPIEYAAKDKILARVSADPAIARQASVVLPRMSFKFNSLIYDGQRKLGATIRRAFKDSNNSGKLSTVYTPVPYNLSFSLFLYVKNMEDGNKIMEQILPFFTPEWNATLILIDSPQIKMDVPVQLDSVEMEDLFDQSFKDRKVLIWTLNFTMKAFLYGPVYSTPLIKFSTANIFVATGTNDPLQGDNTAVVSVAEQPGLLANGSPTSNSSLSIPVTEIFIDNDFGYCETITDNP